jgi:hypothetical protein
MRGGLPRAADRKAGWASVWRPGPAAERPACQRGLRAHRARSPHVVARSLVASRWQGVPRGGAGQGGRGRRSPERLCGVKAVEKPPDSGVHRRGESSGGRW